MNIETFKMIMVMEGISEEIVKEAMAYAGQSGIELRFIPNPTQEYLDTAIAQAWIYGYKSASDKVKSVLAKKED